MQYTYDPNTGRLLTATDCTGTVSYTYNETGELTGVSKNGASVQYAYENDRLSSITSGSTQYTFEYDGFGNRTKTKVGGALLSRNVYDNVTGLLLETGYGNGTEITFEYDKLGRAVSSSVNGVKTYGYEYDSAGRMLRSYEYGSNRAYEFIYDMRGRLAAKKCTDGSSVIFSYDSKDYLKSSSVMLPGQKLGTAYHYGSGSSNQPYKSRVYGVTITDATAVKMLLNTSSTSDSLDRLASRSINAVGGKSLVYGYTYGRGTTLPLTLSATVGEVSSTLVYTYDAAGNITSVTDGENITRYSYDNMGQLIREDNPYSQKTCVYAYDSCGNILSRTEYGYTDDENPAGGTAAVYEYNNAAWGDQLTAWNGESITYDAIGNPLLYRGRSLTWTQGRRLAGVSSEGLAAYYTYDESGTRTGKTVNGVISTQYYINGSQILAQKRGEDILYFLYDETGAAVGFKYNNNLYLYRKNLQGDILAVLNGQTGAVEASYTYDAWGRVISSTGALAEINPFRYRGYYYDDETGFYYVSSRYYDPEIGRWINADNVIAGVGGDLKGYNLFAYCFNNPVNMDDQAGNWPKWIKNTVKWVAKNIVKPVVKTVQKTLSKVDLTYSTGVNVSGTPSAWIFNGQIGVSMDTKGNVAIQASGGGGITGGDPGISITRYQSVTNAPNIDKLNDAYYQVGGSIAVPIEGVPVAAGGDVMFMPDPALNTGYFGLTGNVGFGTPGKEFHVEWGTTVTLPYTQFNVYEVVRSVYIKIMEW